MAAVKVIFKVKYMCPTCGYNFIYSDSYMGFIELKNILCGQDKTTMKQQVIEEKIEKVNNAGN